MTWPIAVVLIVLIVFVSEIVSQACKAVTRIMAHRENIERLRNGYPPLDVKSGKTDKMLNVSKLRGKRGKDEDFIEYDEYDNGN
jgi:hypothetical protein